MSEGATGEGFRAFDRLWDYRDPAASERRFREARADAAAAGESEIEFEIATQIARALGLAGRFAEGHEELDAIESRAKGAASVSWVRLLLERGRLIRSAGEPARAVPHFEAALERALALGAEYHAVDAAHMLGIACPPEQALEWNRRAIEIAEGAADPRARGWLPALFNNTAWIHHDRGEPRIALELFERALVLRREKGEEPARRIAEWSVARCLRTLGRVEEALARQRALLAELEADPSTGSDGFIPEEIGECLWTLGRREEAAPHLRAAADLLESIPWVERARVEDLRRRGGGS